MLLRSRRYLLDAIDDIERIGDSSEFGWVILQLLEQAGWFVHVQPPFAGQLGESGSRGVMVLACHPLLPSLDLRFVGETIADCAAPLLIETNKHIRTLAATRASRAA